MSAVRPARFKSMNAILAAISLLHLLWRMGNGDCNPFESGVGPQKKGFATETQRTERRKAK